MWFRRRVWECECCDHIEVEPLGDWLLRVLEGL